MVVSDPLAQVAAVACDVGVGSFSDPPELPGLAHLLEHAVFLGDELNPGENSFEEFMGAHNGYSNAYTSQENTNYYYKIQYDSLCESLSRFAALLSQPLLRASDSQRECHAIESEFVKDKMETTRRMWRLIKHLSNPSHPFHRLSPGNLATLGKSGTNERLVKFHRQFYTPDNMKCVVYGREDPQDLIEMSEKFFGAITKRSHIPPVESKTSCEVYPPVLLGKWVEHIPLREGNGLDIIWPLSGSGRCGAGLLSRLLAEPHPNSALSVLKRKGWATSLSTSVITSTSTFSILKLTIKLTEIGGENAWSVAKIIYTQINLLKAESHLVLRGRLLQIHQEALQAFINHKNEQAHHFVKSVAARIGRVLHPAYFLGAPVQAGSINCLIRTLVNIIPQNSITMFGTTLLKNDVIRTEPWYNISYTTANLTNIDLQELASPRNIWGLTPPPTPKGNIVKLFPLFERDIDQTSWPTLIYHNSGLMVWWQQDYTFHTPKTDIALWIFRSKEHGTPYETAQHYILAEMIRDQLSDKMLPVGYHIDVRYQSSSGLVLFISGYSDHDQIMLSLKQLVSVILRLDLGQTDRFNWVVRYHAHREIAKSHFAEAYKHPLYKSRVLLEKNISPLEDILAAIDTISIKSFGRFYKIFMMDIGIRALVYGNIIRSMAEQYTTPLLLLLQNTAVEVSDTPFHPTLQYPKGVYMSMTNYPNDQETTSVADITYVLGPTPWNSDDIRSDNDLFTRSVLSRLIATVLQEPAFAELRTKQQLGYSVFTKYISNFGIDYIHVCIQGSEHSAIYMANAILSFLEDFRSKLAAMLSEPHHWSILVETVKKTILEKPTSQHEMVERLSSEIFSPDADPDRPDMMVAALEKLTTKDVLNFYEEYILGAERRTIISLSERANGQSTNEQLNVDFQKFEIGNKTDHVSPFLYWHFTYLGIEMGK